jgi:two-component system NtrC family sensor kinase
VADEGSGMGEQVLARVFEPFFTTRGERALGLGLSTARAIVERHGGRITIQSAPGEGTIATVVLPAIP